MVNIFNKKLYTFNTDLYISMKKIHFFYECLNYIKKKKITKNGWKKIIWTWTQYPKEKKNVRIRSDFLIGPNGPREIWCGQWAGSKKNDPILMCY